MAQETQDLLNQISKSFSDNCKNDKKLNAAYKAASGPNASYADAAECADRIGTALAKAFKDNLSSTVLEGGRLSYEDALSILEPTLGRAYQMNALACEKVQQTLNKAAGIGLKAQSPEYNQDRIDGFARRIGSEENYDDVAWILDEPVKTYSRSVVDDSIKRNADFQYRAGLSPKIVRTAEAKCCDWCASLEGEYDYPLENTDVYRRHDNCRCVVEYKPGDGRVQNAHNKQWRDDEDARDTRIRNASALERAADAARKDRNNIVNGEKNDIIKKERINDYIGKKIIKTDNQSIREWYVANVSNIPNLIDTTKSIEEQAKQAFKLRNEFKWDARIAMSDETTAKELERVRAIPKWEELIESKMLRKNMTREEAVMDILNTASKTNDDVNKEFGL